jgi:hypothetical protein
MENEEKKTKEKRRNREAKREIHVKKNIQVLVESNQSGLMDPQECNAWYGYVPGPPEQPASRWCSWW